MSEGGPKPPPRERRRPLPNLLALPDHLYRRLSPRARRDLRWALALTGVVLVALAVVFVPQIQDSKRERAADQARTERAQRVERRRAAAAEQRPRSGRAAAAGVAATVAALEDEIRAHLAGRAERGEADFRADGVRCSTEAGPSGPRLLADCLAVTSSFGPTVVSQAGRVGYPYRALLDPRSGSFTYCKVVGRAGEGGLRRALVPLPAACGG